MAVGSGALSTLAFDGEVSAPEADFRVIADAQLRIRSARDSSGNPIVSDYNDASNFTGLDAGDINITDDAYSSTYGDFESSNLDGLISDVGSPSALGLEINQEANDQLAVRLGVSNRLTESVQPFIEVSNHTATDYKVRVNFAESDGSGGVGGNNGYGSNVKTDTTDYTEEDASSNEVSRQLVQEVFQFSLDATDYNGRNDVGDLDDTEGQSGDDALISPDPSTGGNDPDKADAPVHISGGETVFVKLDLNTDSGSEVSDIPGKINAVAGGGGGSPWTSNSLVDLLDEVFVQAETV